MGGQDKPPKVQLTALPADNSPISGSFAPYTPGNMSQEAPELTKWYK